MKVFYLCGEYGGCNYVRCFLPMFHNGWTGNHAGIGQELKPVKVCEQEMINADIVVFHRPNTNWHHRVGMKLREMGKKIVFDNDDTMQLDNFHPFWNLDEKGFEENKDKVNNVINNFVLNADLVTCSTEYLAKEYREINKNTFVLPNCVDSDDWDTPLRNKGDKVRIGLVGSVAYHHDFDRIQDVLRKLDADDRIQLVVLGLVKKTSNNPKIAKVYKKEFAFWETLKNLEWTPWVKTVDYFDTLNELRLDIMLIPRRENHFNKAKSNVKFLEAGMLEIPVIAQSFKNAPYEDDIDGFNGLLVKDDKDWLTAIYSLVNNKEKRRNMGRLAREYTLKNYDINNHYKEWGEVYKTLL